MPWTFFFCSNTNFILPQPYRIDLYIALSEKTCYKKFENPNFGHEKFGISQERVLYRELLIPPALMPPFL